MENHERLADVWPNDGCVYRDGRFAIILEICLSRLPPCLLHPKHCCRDIVQGLRNIGVGRSIPSACPATWTVVQKRMKRSHGLLEEFRQNVMSLNLHILVQLLLLV